MLEKMAAHMTEGALNFATWKRHFHQKRGSEGERGKSKSEGDSGSVSFPQEFRQDMEIPSPSFWGKLSECARCTPHRIHPYFLYLRFPSVNPKCLSKAQVIVDVHRGIDRHDIRSQSASSAFAKLAQSVALNFGGNGGQGISHDFITYIYVFFLLSVSLLF